MATNSATETMQQQHIQSKHTTHNLDHQAHARGCMFVLSQMRVTATGQWAHMTGLHVADRNARSCQQHAFLSGISRFPGNSRVSGNSRGSGIPVVWEFPWFRNSHGLGIPVPREFPVSWEFPFPGKFPCRRNSRETGNSRSSGIPEPQEFPARGFPLNIAGLGLAALVASLVQAKSLQDRHRAPRRFEPRHL